MFETKSMYGDLGKTYTSFSKKERTQPVDEQLAALQAQLDRSRAKHQEKLLLLKQIADIGNYVKGNVQKMEAMNRGAERLGIQPDEKMSMWDKLVGAIGGVDTDKSFIGLHNKTYSYKQALMAGSEDDIYGTKVADWISTFNPEPAFVGPPKPYEMRDDFVGPKPTYDRVPGFVGPVK